MDFSRGPPGKMQRCESFEAFLILLYRLANACKWDDVVRIFGPHKHSKVSDVFGQVITHILAHFCLNLPNTSGLPATFVHLLKKKKPNPSIYRKGGVLSNCVAFLDGTARRIARPRRCQQACFSGHKRYHALKYQFLVFPDGIIGDLYGPLEGRRNDQYVLGQSLLRDKVRDDFRFPVLTPAEVAIHASPAGHAQHESIFYRIHKEKKIREDSQ